MSFSRYMLALSLGSLLLGGCSKKNDFPDAVKLRVGSYNLRMQNLDSGDDSWSLRRSRVVRSIADNNFDVFGVQELTEEAQQELSWDLGARYAGIFFSPYNQDGKGTKAQGVFYEKKRFTVVDYHYFWLGDNPDVKTENDHYTNDPSKSYIRGGMCLVFQEKHTGKKFFLMNSHAPLNSEDYMKYVHVYRDMEIRYNPAGLPSFFVGDLNTRPDSPVSEVLREYWKDSADICPAEHCTMNSFVTDPAMWPASKRIDYVYYRNTAAPAAYDCNQTLYDGRCASDHFPVWADFTL